jgi:hypothetical protein
LQQPIHDGENAVLSSCVNGLVVDGRTINARVLQQTLHNRQVAVFEVVGRTNSNGLVRVNALSTAPFPRRIRVAQSDLQRPNP